MVHPFISVPKYTAVWAAKIFQGYSISMRHVCFCRGAWELGNDELIIVHVPLGELGRNDLGQLILLYRFPVLRLDFTLNHWNFVLVETRQIVRWALRSVEMAQV